MKGKHFLYGFLTLLVFTGTIFVALPSQNVRIEVNKDSASFASNVSGRWVVQGVESFSLSGAGKRNLSSVTQHFDGKHVVVTRLSGYDSGVVVVDEYSFDPNASSILDFPAEHSIRVIGGSGATYKYVVKKLLYNGSTIVGVSSPVVSGSMKVAFDPPIRSILSKGMLSLEYKVSSSDETFHVRLFDPPSVTLTSETAEVGTVVNITATDTGVICIDLNDSRYGVNVSCGSTTTTYSYDPPSFVKYGFNDSSTAKNLTFAAAGNQSFGVLVHSDDEVKNLSVVLAEFNYSSSFPRNITIYVNGTQSNFIRSLNGTTSGSVVTTVSAFNDSSTNKQVNFTNTSNREVAWIRIPKGATVVNTSLNLVGLTVYVFQDVATSYSEATVDNDGYAVADYGLKYMTYSIPNIAKNTSIFQYKIGDNTAPFYLINNHSMATEQSCFANNSNSFYFRIRTNWLFLFDGSHQYGTKGDCYNGTGWVTIWQNYAIDVYGARTGVANGDRQNDSDYSTGASYQATEWAYDTGIREFFEGDMYWDEVANNVYVEIGIVDGHPEFYNASNLNYTYQMGNFSVPINEYLASCTEDSYGYCNVPITIRSNMGTMNISGLSVNYTMRINPVAINESLVESQASQSSGFVSVPVTVHSDTAGVLQVSSVTYQYLGGNMSVLVTAHTASYSANATATINLSYAGYDYVLPNNVDYLEFIPRTSNSKNVSMYGQSASSPIFNITSKSYHRVPINMSISYNQSMSCVNISYSTSWNGSMTKIIPNAWSEFKTSLNYQNQSGVWLWADYNCNSTSFQLFMPSIFLRGCTQGYNCSESLT